MATGREPYGCRIRHHRELGPRKGHLLTDLRLERVAGLKISPGVLAAQECFLEVLKIGRRTCQLTADLLTIIAVYEQNRVVVGLAKEAITKDKKKSVPASYSQWSFFLRLHANICAVLRNQGDSFVHKF